MHFSLSSVPGRHRWLPACCATLLLVSCESGGSARDGHRDSQPSSSSPSADLLATSGKEAVSVEVDGQWRPSLRVPAGEKLQWQIDVPAAGRLSLGLAMHPEGWVLRRDGVYARVQMNGQTVAEQWICPRDLPAHRRWIDLDLDLADWAGQSAELSIQCSTALPPNDILRARPSTGGESLLVSRPLLRSASDSRPNVLLIVIDTLRRDALHSYGHPEDLSPHIDALAASGARFTKAFSTAPWTHPSTASLLSGWTPWQHGLGHGPAGTTQLDPETPLIAVDFQRAGYATGAVSGNGIVSPDEGFARGFDHFDTRAFENEQSHSAQRLTRNALQWLAPHRHQPFFAYLHYFDPHDRYQAPSPYTRRFVDPHLEESHLSGYIRQGASNPLREGLEDGHPGLTIRDEELRYLKELYAGEVAYVDHWVGRLLDELESWGVLDNTFVVLTSDHGEEFYDHGFFKHGHSLYDELVAVPLIVKAPRSAAWTTHSIDTPVSLLDLAPTLRDLVGLEIDGDQRARSWRPLLESTAAAPRRPLLLANYSRARGAWAGRQRGLIRWPYKWVENRGPDRVQLFDLAADPGEHVDLHLHEVELTKELESQCSSLYGTGSVLPHPNAPVDEERLEKLKAMGYVH